MRKERLRQEAQSRVTSLTPRVSHITTMFFPRASGPLPPTVSGVIGIYRLTDAND